MISASANETSKTLVSEVFVQENNSDSGGVANKLVNKILNESNAQAKSEIVQLKDKDKSASIATAEAKAATEAVAATSLSGGLWVSNWRVQN